MSWLKGLTAFSSIVLASGFFISISWLALPAWATISVSNSAPKQGETIEISWQPGDGKGVLDYEVSPTTSITFNGNNCRLFPVAAHPGTYRCLIAIPANLTPGKYPLAILQEQTMLKVIDAKFPVQHLTLPKSKNNFIMSAGEEQIMNATKAVLSDKRLWQGNFVKPCQARLSAQFGIRRVVNGALLKDYFHSGIDFAGALGQPVLACADGKVVLAHRGFRLHGNVIGIDHGQGIISIYIHLQKIIVKEGETVSAGQQIGNVGATGRANGPHLHLSLYVNQTAANPLPWFSKAFRHGNFVFN